MLAARAQAIRKQKQKHPFVEEGVLLSKLMAYCSKEAHSCVEKAAMICFVKLRILEPDDKCSLRGGTLQQVGYTLRGNNTNVCSDTSMAVTQSEQNIYMPTTISRLNKTFITPETSCTASTNRWSSSRRTILELKKSWVQPQ
jgi:hypothetical protein